MYKSRDLILLIINGTNNCIIMSSRDAPETAINHRNNCSGEVKEDIVDTRNSNAGRGTRGLDVGLALRRTFSDVVVVGRIIS